MGEDGCGKLSFEPKPREYSTTTVDEPVVKCSGQPLYAWVGADAMHKKPIPFGVSYEQHKTQVAPTPLC